MTEEIDFKPTNSTLQLTVSLIRHGERAPIVLFPKDVNRDYWPNGLGNLTGLGKQQAYDLGQQLRAMYEGYLSPTYKPDEVHARSTDVERCLITAQACMTGLYPAPSGNDDWKADSPWQPVPVHTSSRLLDPCMVKIEGFVDLPCDKISPECQKFLYENKELVDTVLEVSKYPKNIFMVGMLLQSVFEEMKLGLPTPHDFGKSLEELRPILAKMFDFFVTVYPAVLIPTAHTLAECHGVIKKKIDGQNPKLKAFMFFTHDVVMSCFLETLCDEHEKPTFVGALFFEVHKHPDNGHNYVRVVYKNGLNGEPRDVKLRGYQSLCRFEDFEKVILNFINFYKV